MNTDYLRFDSNSLKELIINKLNVDGTYSDQLFPGSDLTVLIDMFCYMFDTMTFLENVGAAEAIFTDTQYYENMNRIVKMLGYNPLGFITSTVSVALGIKEGKDWGGNTLATIPKFTNYVTDLNDSKGNPIIYTFTEDFAFPIDENTVPSNFTPKLFNGTWKTYPNNFVSTGIPFETFTLTSIDISLADRQLISHDNIKVYILEEDGIYYEYIGTSNLYTSRDDKALQNGINDKNRFFEYRLNENKQYTLTFGDNISSKQLSKDMVITVIYLESNGPDGEIGAEVINSDGFLTIDIEGLDYNFIETNIYKNDPTYIPIDRLELITLNNNIASTSTKDLENVESIRRYAPDNFRTGGRLITEQDFEQYILAKWPTSVYDVSVVNNWKYMTEFQTWLKRYDKLNPDISHFDYEFADSCEFNNIYLLLKAFDTNPVPDASKRDIESTCNKLKPTTSELIPVNSFNTVLTPYLSGDKDIKYWDPNIENKIVLIRDNNTMTSIERIKQKANTIVLNFFNLKNQSLGATIDINNLYNQLMAIDGVKKVQTSYLKHGEIQNKTQYFDGLSFALWTSYLLNGEDFTTITGNYKLLSFQFPMLLNPNNFINLIEVVSDIYNISNIEF